MQAHHVLMIERDKEGNRTPHEVPNNEWARCRRKGWQFATTEEKAAYAVDRAEAAAAAKEAAEELKEAEEKERSKAGKKDAAKGGGKTSEKA